MEKRSKKCVTEFFCLLNYRLNFGFATASPPTESPKTMRRRRARTESTLQRWRERERERERETEISLWSLTFYVHNLVNVSKTRLPLRARRVLCGGGGGRKRSDAVRTRPTPVRPRPARPDEIFNAGLSLSLSLSPFLCLFRALRWKICHTIVVVIVVVDSLRNETPSGQATWIDSLRNETSSGQVVLFLFFFLFFWFSYFWGA